MLLMVNVFQCASDCAKSIISFNSPPNYEVGAFVSNFTNEEIKQTLQACCRLGRYTVWQVRIGEHIKLTLGPSS